MQLCFCLHTLLLDYNQFIQHNQPHHSINFNKLETARGQAVAQLLEDLL